MRRFLAVALAAVLLIALAAPALAKAPPVKKATVGGSSPVSYALKPGHLTIRLGTKVVWKWVGGYHNVTVRSGPVKFHSADKLSGTYSHVFKKKGTYHLYCTLHQYMKETVVVR